MCGGRLSWLALPAQATPRRSVPDLDRQAKEQAFQRRSPTSATVSCTHSMRSVKTVDLAHADAEMRRAILRPPATSASGMTGFVLSRFVTSACASDHVRQSQQTNPGPLYFAEDLRKVGTGGEFDPISSTPHSPQGFGRSKSRGHTYSGTWHAHVTSEAPLDAGAASLGATGAGPDALRRADEMDRVRPRIG